MGETFHEASCSFEEIEPVSLGGERHIEQQVARLAEETEEEKYEAELVSLKHSRISKSQNLKI
jgi:hypothetical protein